ncbi:RICIN domain-containing protein [Bacillus wiedmannii]|uniref:RICIN domain-containing protein n=1 Tax=Bacillus wiedmannii TaxID=1890302 RepID=UPI000B74232B|nr:RICIN domain-containing protein [Bacillus wiedmannii]OUB80914.1 hypothetical protein BK788_25110 [Bacillus thuringiensis serovar sinensis]
MELYSGTEDDNTKKRRSEALIRAQYNSINDYMNNLSGITGNVLINGDMTAFGHGSEWDKISSLVRTLNRPYYYGLGNHDIENNFGNCTNNGCFKNSLSSLIQHVNNRPLPISFDHRSYGQSWYTVHEGSFGYAVNFGTICSIQLQHDPKMNKTAEANFWSSRPEKFSIFENFNWVEAQLRTARNNGQTIIVNIHSNDRIPSNYITLFRQYGVAAVFSGHIHTSYGRAGSVGNIPHFRSGSTALSTYLILEQYTDRLEIYSVSCNNWRVGRREHTISLHPPSFVPDPNSRYQIVTALNNSSALDMNPNNNNVHLWRYEGQNNAQWRFTYDQSRSSYVIRNVSNQNLVLAWNVPSTNNNVFATPFVPNNDEHYWIIEPFQDGYIFKNKRDESLVLDVVGSSTGNGTNIVVHNRHSLNTTARNQTFFIRRI